MRSVLSIPARLFLIRSNTVRYYSTRPPSPPRTETAQRKRPSALGQQENIEQLSTPAVIETLRQCADTRDRQRGEALRALISFYIKCKDMESAQTLFDSTKNKPLFLCGAMMKGYLDNGMPQKVIDLFHEIEDRDTVMYILFFQACARIPVADKPNLVTNIAAQIPKQCFSNPRLVTAAIDALMKYGAVQQAEALFTQQTTKDVYMVGAMMKGYVEQEMAPKALDLFNQVKHPDAVIYVLFFKACAQLPAADVADLVKNVGARIPRRLHSDQYLVTSWTNALMKSGYVEQAQSLFDQSKNRTLAMHGAMIEGFVHNEMPEKAIALFHSIKNPNDIIYISLFKAFAQLKTVETLERIKEVSSQAPRRFYSNPRFSTSLINALMMCGGIREAEELFNQVPTKDFPMYGAMMKGFITHGIAQRALRLYNHLPVEASASSKIPQSDIVVHLLALKALARIGMESLCDAIVRRIPHHFLRHLSIQTALVDMWGKVNRVDQSREVFDSMSELDGVSYAAMINGYGMNGRCAEAIGLFRRVPAPLIEQATYVSVLNACSHAGHVNEARTIFANIPIKTDQTYGAMVDCLSRAGLFAEAQQLIEQYELLEPPSSPMYMALLSGARNENNTQVAEAVYHRMKALFPQPSQQSVSATVLLADVYASAGQSEMSSDLRADLHQTGLRKEVALTPTFVDGHFVQFRTHDRSHPRRDEIHAEAAKLAHEIEQHGHEYDGSWVTHPLAADEIVVSALCGHSERLAIAFNFVVNPHASVIHLTSNLRICGDCHRATKLIAAIRRCRIVVWDANRMHVFGTDGRCSCNDYF